MSNRELFLSLLQSKFLINLWERKESDRWFESPRKHIPGHYLKNRARFILMIVRLGRIAEVVKGGLSSFMLLHTTWA